jgi:hypothetical protein
MVTSSRRAMSSVWPSSMQHFVAGRRRLRMMGEAAYETARQFTWHRFRRSVGEIFKAIWENGR